MDIDWDKLMGNGNPEKAFDASIAAFRSSMEPWVPGLVKLHDSIRQTFIDGGATEEAASFLANYYFRKVVS